jgi:preprotein translocase subunit SecE
MADVSFRERVERYGKDTTAELRKMTWPTRDEIVASTIVVIIVSLIFSAFIGVIDRILVAVVKAIFGGA